MAPIGVYGMEVILNQYYIPIYDRLYRNIYYRERHTYTV